jgi:O-antigen/teichoic acid export membrane protein
MAGSGIDAAEGQGSGGLAGLRGRFLRYRWARAMQGEGLRARAIRGSGWTMVGFGGQQVLRLGSSLVLTRLLFPEAYGLMAIANVYITGLQMFSDVGLRHSIIQNPRGLDAEFLNTAWTMQIVRGFLLWFVSCLIAYPVSLFYDAPVLFPILCVLGFTAAIRGFQTTAYVTGNRRLQLGRITLVELTTQAVGILVILAWASVHPSVWALAGGGAVSAVFSVCLGFAALPSHRHRLQWDRSCASEILGFGKWIFLATVLGYLANNGDRLVLGKFMTTADFGMYALAMTWAGLVKNINGKIGERVLVPIYAARRDSTPEEMRPKIARMRLAKAALVLPVSAVLILFGQQLIELMYDSRYYGAGWMLQALAVGVAFLALMNIGDFMLSRGRSRLFFFVVCMDTATSLGCLLVGGLLGGPPGIVLGVAAAPIIKHLYMIEIYRRHGYWLWKLDVFFVLILGALVALALVLNQGP